MTPDQFKAAGLRLYGRKKWMVALARDLGVDRTTVYRYTRREQIPGPVEVAMAGLLQNKKARDEIEKAARQLLPRKLRRKRK